MAHSQSLEEAFKAHPPAMIKQARSLIAAATTIERSPTQVRNFLLRLGLKGRRVGTIPAKPDVEQQAAFLSQKLEPRLAAAAAGQRKVFFLDAAHFVLAPFVGFLWSVARLFIQAPSGRQPFKVLGALEAITNDILLVTNQTYITPSRSWRRRVPNCRSPPYWITPDTNGARSSWCTPRA